MTYCNASVYVESPTEFAHDACLPDSEFDPIVINGKTEDDHGEPFGRQQKSPWNWAPLYGASHPCKYCGKPVR